jgi:hypothetical protein
MKNQKIKEYIELERKWLKEQGLKNGDYCIIVNTDLAGTFKDAKIRFVYKNLKTFEKKIEKDIEKIDPTSGINFLLAVFEEDN